jgi:polyhydroxybutyrate depolymerase
MKRLLIILIAISFSFCVYSQTYKSDSIKHDGLSRHYLLYVPNIYNPGKPTPLVFNLHGLGSNSLEQIFYGNFMPIADTANFILVVPDGTAILGSQFWNVGIIPSSVDDIGFLEDLIDSLALQYNINRNRVYSTGMSNGGFMSYYLACHSKLFTAIASVTGDMTPANYTSCAPTRPTPVMEIHGTADSTVPYNGNTLMKPIEDVVNYWVDFNSCVPIPVTTNVPDINTTDNANAVHYVYNGGTNGATVEFFKVIGGGHTWPGTAFASGATCMDFNACVEIWRFFSKYSMDKLQGIPELARKEDKLVIYPNPVGQSSVISYQLSEKSHVTLGIYDITGREINKIENGKLKMEKEEQRVILDVGELKSGVYFVRLSCENWESVAKFIKL